ncbi:MAG TPA: hypothetical protein VEW07_12210 [Solirubrobacterales bacterium]|nr:hypothetical protein [Solirubrobacterales bacterium]
MEIGWNLWGMLPHLLPQATLNGGLRGRDLALETRSLLGVLSYLLPGLRHLRAPLAAGYLWLTAGYFALTPVIPTHSEATGVLADAYNLADSVGSPSLIAASAFVAYLIGLLSAELSKSLVLVTTRAARRLGSPPSVAPRDERQRGSEVAPRQAKGKLKPAFRRWAGSGEADLSLRGEKAATLIAEDRERRIESVLRREEISWEEVEESIPLGRAISGDDPLHVLFDIAEVSEKNLPRAASDGGPSEGLTQRVITDLRLSKLRLLEKAPEVFEEVDRIESEAEMRLAVVPPLLALIAVLAVRSSILWLAGLLLVAFLFQQGIRCRQERGDQIIDAVSVGTVEPPELERLARVFDEVHKDIQQRRVDRQATGGSANPEPT